MTQASGISKAPRKEYAPGDVIGDKYVLVRLLGEGGMGSVWVAENMSLRANVALKLIRADVAEASANERFLSEARLAARLQHAAIVRVFDFGKTEHDEPYIVMELLEGETLGQRLTRLGAIDPTELCQTLLPIIDALHSAHGHGVIHRDLKPDNVFVAKTDGGGVQPKLLDFGIAKLRGEGAVRSTKLTQAGTLIGSPDYMSPEQARGETDLDPRSDVWALCVLAYECLVGKPPFHGDNYNALLWAIIHDEPVPITVFQAGDSELWRILKVGFAKDRNVRWESARRLGEAIAAWLESHGVMEDVCNRSLQASWLPAERPTRPELAPFDPRGPGLPQRRPSPASMAPPPTLAAIRRPHTMSLWFAALGLLTLLGAVFLSKSDRDLIPTVDVSRGDVTAAGRQKVGTLLPGPAPETREPGELEPNGVPGYRVPGAVVPDGVVPDGVVPDGVVPDGVVSDGVISDPVVPGAMAPGARSPAATPGGVASGGVSQGATLPGSELSGMVPHGGARQPIREEDGRMGASAREPSNPRSSWKANHDRSHSREASSGASRNGLGGLDPNARDLTDRERASATDLAGDKRRATKPKPPVETKPKPPRASGKKSEQSPTGDTEVDFGI
jgi:serine/threonine protein kinase